MIDLAPMAKRKRSQRTAAEGPGPEPSRRATVLTIRGTPEWREWLDRASRHCRMSASTLVDLAVAKFVREQGFSEPPPDR